MSDYEYLDDEDYYDDEEDDDEDEELGGDWRSRLGSSSGLPGRDRSTGVLGSSGGRSSSLPGANPASRSPFSPSGSSTRDRATRPSSSGGSDWRSKINPSDKPSDSRSSSSGGSSDWRSKINPNDKSSDSKPSSSGSGSDWRSTVNNKPSSSDNKGGGSGWRSSFNKDKDNKANDRKSRLDTLSKAGTSGDKPTEKKDSSGGGFLNKASSVFSSSDDKKTTDKKSSSGGGLLGKATSVFSSSDDKKTTDKKPTDKKSSSGGGGFLNKATSVFSSGGDKKTTDKKATARKADSKKSDSDGGGFAMPAAASGILGKISPFGGGKKDDAKQETQGNSKFRNKDKQVSDKKQSRFGASKSSKQPKAEARKAAKADTKDSEGGGLFSNVFSRFRGGDEDQTKSSAKSSKSTKARTSKAPKMEADDWLDLDRKLDLVGVGLVFGSILLFFSALSQEQAAISFVHNLIGQLFGWGALAVPITMFAVGMWLIVRHFGDDAPTVDPLRLTGAVIGFIGVLMLFQYMESFSYIEMIPEAQSAALAECQVDPNEGCIQDMANLDQCRIAITASCLEGLVKYSYEQNQGGGLVGGWLYLTLVNNLTEIGGFVIVVMVLTFAMMMLTRLSMAEIAVVVIGIWRSLRTSMAQSAARRRAQRLREEQQKALAAQSASVSVSMPSPAQLPGNSVATNALPEPSNDPNAIPIEERDILIRRGGQAFSSTELQQESVFLGVNAQQTQQQDNGGLFGRLFGRNKAQPQQPSYSQQPNFGAPATQSSVGLIGRLFGRGGDDNQPQGQPILPPGQPQYPQPVQNPVATNMPVGSNGADSASKPQGQPQQPPVQQPQVQGQQPQVQGQQPQVQGQQPQQPPVSQPAQEQPVQQPQQANAVAETDRMAQRQDRLNAIRSGMTAPQAPTAKPTSSSVQVENSGASGSDYNPFGRPDDIPTHETEKLPGQDKSSTTVQRAQEPQGNTPAATVQKPVSTGPTNQTRKRINWKLPDYRTLLSSGSEQEFDREHLLNQARVIEETLASFGAPGRVVEVNTGPVITQFGIEPDYLTSRSGKKSRVKVSAIAQLDKDLQLALGAKSIRVEAPVPGKGYVGIEVPNTQASLVSLRDVMESESFQKIKSPLGIALGMAVDGTPISADLTSMPHLLIAGTTGSGKSVCVNAIINSIVATNSPEQVKFIMVDPKRVELTGYNGLPHLVAPVVVELERIVGVLKWVTREMDERYKKFSNIGARNIIDYNKQIDSNLEPMPYIVVIIDELADLMMMAPEETERTITRIAALARATGIHLVIATQRPSVDVVTGLIKANFPARIAFAVAGGVDSRVILDQPGAERLLGKGDMLYLSGNSPAPLRLQGVFVSDMEISNIGRYWKAQSVGVETVKPISALTGPTQSEAMAASSGGSSVPTIDRTQQSAFWDTSNSNTVGDPNQLAIEDKTGNPDPQEDELYQTAVDMVRRLDKASISLLQRRLRIGYTRAARLIDMMEERGVVGPAKEGSSKPRDVIPE